MRLGQGTFSFLPDLSDQQIAAQLDYCLGRGWALSIEFTVRLSFIVNRPSSEPGFRLERSESRGRAIRYTTHAFAADRPEGSRY